MSANHSIVFTVRILDHESVEAMFAIFSSESKAEEATCAEIVRIVERTVELNPGIFAKDPAAPYFYDTGKVHENVRTNYNEMATLLSIVCPGWNAYVESYDVDGPVKEDEDEMA